MSENPNSLTWKLERKKLSALVEYEKNPRRLTKAQYSHLRNSLDKFGLIDKPIINLDNMIIGGHQRIKTLLATGTTEADCWIPNRLLIPKEVEELNIRLNKNSGEWDFDKLANEFETLLICEWGFDTKELAKELDIALPLEAPDEEPDTCDQCGQKIKKHA